MRLTVNLDDDLYALVRSIARDADISLTSAVNRLVRGALTRHEIPSITDDGTGFPTVQGSRPFSSEDVARMEAEFGL